MITAALTGLLTGFAAYCWLATVAPVRRTRSEDQMQARTAFGAALALSLLAGLLQGGAL